MIRHHHHMGSSVPVQYFQSIIAIQLAVTGALLFQVRFFDTKNTDREPSVDPRLRLLMVVVLAATLFASLEAMREGWGSLAAAVVTAGLALSLLPIVLAVLPPLTRDVETHERDPHLWVTVLGLILYFATVTIIVLIR
jgi:glucose-6-phosphate-specific signal transduction histidine kinase